MNNPIKFIVPLVSGIFCILIASLSNNLVISAIFSILSAAAFGVVAYHAYEKYYVGSSLNNTSIESHMLLIF